MKASQFLVAVLAGLSVLLMGAPVWAQATCQDILFDGSGNLRVFPDSAWVMDVSGKPGDTINVPINLVNTKDVAALQVYFEFDTTLIKPILRGTEEIFDTAGNVIDTNFYYDFDVTARWDTTEARAEIVGDIDFDPPAGWERIKILGIPRDFFSLDKAIDAGSGEIISLRCEIIPTAQQNDFVTIDNYYETIYNDSFPPEPIGCQFSQYTDTSGLFTGALSFPDIAGRVIVDTAATEPPTIVSFTASPSTISSGQTSTLSWEVLNADSVVISPGVGTFTNLNSSTTVSPTATTNYTLTAYNASVTQPTSTAIVTVSDDPTNNSPVVASLTQTSYTITVGETVSFQVSASDTDGDPITLSATNLPTNATFGVGGQVTGVGSAEGTFSFTPNTGQDGVYQVGFVATDDRGGTSNTETVTITVEGIQFDILFTTSAPDKSPVGGQPGKQTVLCPINLVTSQTVYGVEFGFQYDADVFDVDSVITTPRTADYVVYENIDPTTAGDIKILTFGMNNEPIVDDTTANSAILQVALSIDAAAAPGNYPIYIDSGRESVNPDPEFPSLPLVTDSGIVQVDFLGDVNLDQYVDVADAVNIVAEILGNFSLNDRQFDAGDVIDDDLIDVFDLVGVVNLIFGIPVSPAPGQFAGPEAATVAMDYEDLTIGAVDYMVVRSELPELVAGVELDVSYDPSAVALGPAEISDDASGLTMTYKDDDNGNMKVLMHYTNPFDEGALIPRGSVELVRIPMRARTNLEAGDDSRIRLSNVLLSNPSAQAVRVEGYNSALPETFELYQNYPNPFNPTTVIEFALDGGDGGGWQHVNLDVYNILGQHVATLIDMEMAPGHHQLEWDATTDDGRGIASGIYLYRLRVGNKSDSRKMIFLK